MMTKMMAGMDGWDGGLQNNDDKNDG